MMKIFPTDDDRLEDTDSKAAPRNEAQGSFDFYTESEKKELANSVAAPESLAETTRKSGLAWSVGIAFFASVVFMMLLGYGADLLLGSAPWGIVGGIVVGSLIGFFQLFKLSSQIFDK